MLKALKFCIPTVGTSVPDGPDWLHEMKYDGYRLRVERDGDRWPGDVRLSDLESRFTCHARGRRGADVRPDWRSKEKIDWRRMIGIEAARWLDYAV
jgi:hypothetical protein